MVMAKILFINLLLFVNFAGLNVYFITYNSALL
jgi:hypothetical protein